MVDVMLSDAEKAERSEEFQYWLSDFERFDTELRDFVGAQRAAELDYSVQSLATLEAHLLETYDAAAALTKPENAGKHNAAAVYFGETVRRNVGGVWRLPLDDPDYMFFGKPELQDIPAAGRICPMSYVSAALNRRRSDFLQGLVSRWVDKAGE